MYKFRPMRRICPLLFAPLCLAGCDGHSDFGLGTGFAAFFEIIIQAFYLEILAHVFIIVGAVLTVLFLAAALGLVIFLRDRKTKDTRPKEIDPD